MGHGIARVTPRNNWRTTDATLTQRRRYASVPPKGVRLTHRLFRAVADWRNAPSADAAAGRG